MCNDSPWVLISVPILFLQIWEVRTWAKKSSWSTPVARKNAPPVDMSCSSRINGSDIEQIVHNRIGRISLEWVEIWNEFLWWNSVVVSCNDSSSRMYLHNHIKLANEIKKHQNMFHYFMLVTKESNNKIHDNNTTYFMGKEPILHQIMKKKFSTFALVSICSFTMPIPCAQKLQLSPFMLTLLI